MKKNNIFTALLLAFLFWGCSEAMDDMKCAAGDNKACAKSIDRELDRADEIMKNMKHQF